MPDRYALFGHPIGHSKSPLIHRLFAVQAGQVEHHGGVELDVGVELAARLQLGQGVDHARRIGRAFGGGVAYRGDFSPNWNYAARIGLAVCRRIIEALESRRKKLATNAPATSTEAPIQRRSPRRIFFPRDIREGWAPGVLMVVGG